MTRLGAERKDIRLLSVGTGIGSAYYPIGERNWLWGFVAGWGIKKFISMLLNLQSITAGNVTKLLLDQGQMVRINFKSDRPLADDRVVFRRAQDQVAQPFRSRAHLAVGLRLQQVDEERVRDLVPEPGGLSSPPRAKEKKALGRDPQKTTLYFHFETRNGTVLPKI
jgi:hypothetical protein